MALAAAVLAAAGCTAPIRDEAAPRCTKVDTLVLMAQSVPSAQRLPCIQVDPAGWTFGDMDIGTGESTFTLDSTDAGLDAVRVTLAARCSTAGATEVTSDERDTQQFERIESLVDYRGTRTYVFPGGCVTYRFRFDYRGEELRRLVNEVSLALNFSTREHIADEVRRTSGGRLEL
jgi:hypothetical protein